MTRLTADARALLHRALDEYHRLPSSRGDEPMFQALGHLEQAVALLDRADDMATWAPAPDEQRLTWALEDGVRV